MPFARSCIVTQSLVARDNREPARTPYTRHVDAEVAEPSIFSRDLRSFADVRRRDAPLPFTLEEKELTRLVKRSVPRPKVPLRSLETLAPSFRLFSPRRCATGVPSSCGIVWRENRPVFSKQCGTGSRGESRRFRLQ